MPVQGAKPRYHYARRHDYIFYPIAWVDQSTGTSYEAGYYDEDGKRYDSVAFKKGDSYDNVVCHCPYCDQDTILNLTSEQIASHSLKCPNCNGQMEIQSALDEYTDATGASGGSYTDTDEVKSVKKKNNTLKWVIVALAVLLSLKIWGGDKKEPVQQNTGTGSGTTVVQNNNAVSNTDLFGSVLYLVQHEDGSYGVLTDPIRENDKTLIWDADSEAYYDSSTECWIWYNTNVSPNIWQYWYEGISSEYDEGWMEYDTNEQCWYIEKTSGNWIKLPSKYNSSRLWYIS